MSFFCYVNTALQENCLETFTLSNVTTLLTPLKLQLEFGINQPRSEKLTTIILFAEVCCLNFMKFEALIDEQLKSQMQREEAALTKDHC